MKLFFFVVCLFAVNLVLAQKVPRPENRNASETKKEWKAPSIEGRVLIDSLKKQTVSDIWLLPDTTLRKKALAETILGTALITGAIWMRQERSIPNLRSSEVNIAFGVYLNIHAWKTRRYIRRGRKFRSEDRKVEIP